MFHGLPNAELPGKGEIRRITLDDGFQLYIEYAKRRFSPSEIGRVGVVRRYWRKSYPKIEADDMTPVRLHRWRRKLKADGLTRKTINAYCAIFLRAARWMTHRRFMSPQTFGLLNLLPRLNAHSGAREPVPKAVPPWHVIADTLEAIPCESARDLLRLCYLADMWPSEAARMRGDDIDRESRPDAWVYHPNSHKTKSRDKKRTVVFGPEAQEIVQRHVNKRRLEAGTIFRDDSSKSWSNEAIRRHIRRACRRIGVAAWSPRDLLRSRYMLHGGNAPE
jgi:hypothetical protein